MVVFLKIHAAFQIKDEFKNHSWFSNVPSLTSERFAFQISKQNV